MLTRRFTKPFLPTTASEVSPARHKMMKFKPKVAKTTQLKTPSMLALDHFDFYYGPLFGKKWPSIRLGLLSPKKYVTVLNRFSLDADENEETIKNLGAIDLLGEMKQMMVYIENINEADSETHEETPQSFSGERESYKDDDYIDDMDNTIFRSSAGIRSFRPPTETFEYGSDESKKTKQDLEITGLEGMGYNMTKVNDFISIPNALKVYTYDRNWLNDFPAPVKDVKNISSWWHLDGASVLPVLALDLRETDNVLDMCAAPGGKSLLMLQIGNFDRLTCNDFKMSRLGQLRRGLASYIPNDSPIVEKVILKRRDGSDLKHWDDIAIYDKVLVDAPCTTDKISLQTDEGNIFSPSMTKTRLDLPNLQTKILLNALRSVKIGGYVVYSTCSLAPNQNDVVVDNAASLAETRYGIKVVEKSLRTLEKRLVNSGLFRFSYNCHRGHLIVPFLPSNFGPMYICKMQRVG